MTTRDITTITTTWLLSHAKTGDLLLCHETPLNYWNPIGWLSILIQRLGYSRYSHIGMIVHGSDLPESPLPSQKDPDNLYFLESSLDRSPDVFNGHQTFGVECVSLNNYLSQYSSGVHGDLYYRALEINRDTRFRTSFRTSFYHSLNKSYDLHPWDWIRAKFDIESCGQVQRDDTFWCSALVAYFYVQWGILDKDIPWTLIAPRRFSHYENQELSFKQPLHPEKKLLK